MTNDRCLALAFLLAGIVTSKLSDRGSFKIWRVVNRQLMFSLAGKVSCHKVLINRYYVAV